MCLTGLCLLPLPRLLAGMSHVLARMAVLVGRCVAEPGMGGRNTETSDSQLAMYQHSEQFSQGQAAGAVIRRQSKRVPDQATYENPATSAT